MLVELALRLMVPLSKRKGDIKNCRYYTARRLLEYGMVVESVPEKRLCEIVTVDEM